MTKVTDDEKYEVDLISDDGNKPPPMIQTHLRHLLLACELGDLVLLECVGNDNNDTIYMLCAHVINANNKRKLLPICELQDTDKLLARLRPPLAAENHFVTPTHTGNYRVCLVANPNEVALTEVDAEDSVH